MSGASFFLSRLDISDSESEREEEGREEKEKGGKEEGKVVKINPLLASLFKKKDEETEEEKNEKVQENEKKKEEVEKVEKAPTDWLASLRGIKNSQKIQENQEEKEENSWFFGSPPLDLSLSKSNLKDLINQESKRFFGRSDEEAKSFYYENRHWLTDDFLRKRKASLRQGRKREGAIVAAGALSKARREE